MWYIFLVWEFWGILGVGVIIWLDKYIERFNEFFNEDLGKLRLGFWYWI